MGKEDGPTGQTIAFKRQQVQIETWLVHNAVCCTKHGPWSSASTKLLLLSCAWYWSSRNTSETDFISRIGRFWQNGELLGMTCDHSMTPPAVCDTVFELGDIFVPTNTPVNYYDGL